jgi:hypothetical protein
MNLTHTLFFIIKKYMEVSSMKNLVNFKKLKREEIRKTIGEGEEQIIIYNPSPEKREEISKLLINSYKEKDEMEITGRELLLQIIPMLTNILLEYDENNEEERQIIDDILNDPSEILMEVVDEVSIIVKEVGERTNKTLESLANLSEEEISKIIPINKETEEEKELRELKEKQILLENKIKNKQK